jgi:PTS system mannose-specific IIA component
MTTVILVSHGGMAQGLVQSVEMLIGEQENLLAVTFEPEDGTELLTEKVRAVLLPALEKGPCIVMTDIPNGTPFNCVSRLLENLPFQHLTGMNLPMVINAVSQCDDETLSAEQLCTESVEAGREAMFDVNARFRELNIL